MIAEIQVRGVGAADPRGASMRPRSYDRGNLIDEAHKLAGGVLQ